MSTIFKDFLSASKKLEQDALLNLLCSFDSWSNRGSKNVENVFLFRQFTNVLDVLLAQTGLLLFSEKTYNTSGNNLGPKGTPSHAHMHIGGCSIYTSHFNAVARFYAINQIVLEDDGHTARKLAWRRTFRHFLNRDNLRILVEAVAVLVC